MPRNAFSANEELKLRLSSNFLRSGGSFDVTGENVGGNVGVFFRPCSFKTSSNPSALVLKWCSNCCSTIFSLNRFFFFFSILLTITWLSTGSDLQIMPSQDLISLHLFQFNCMIGLCAGDRVSQRYISVVLQSCRVS